MNWRQPPLQNEVGLTRPPERMLEVWGRRQAGSRVNRCDSIQAGCNSARLKGEHCKKPPAKERGRLQSMAAELEREIAFCLHERRLYERCSGKKSIRFDWIDSDDQVEAPRRALDALASASRRENVSGASDSKGGWAEARRRRPA